jgi:hypothetical protein
MYNKKPFCQLSLNEMTTINEELKQELLLNLNNKLIKAIEQHNEDKIKQINALIERTKKI